MLLELELCDWDTNKEKKIENLKKRDTIGGINFDSVVIADFDENFKSVATSLLYTDVSSKRVLYINLNNWFDEKYYIKLNEEDYEKDI